MLKRRLSVVDTNQQFYELYFQKVLTENMIQQLELEGQSIEQAISQIHQEQLERINMTIKSIWQKVYHEKDIETIQINALADESSSKGNSKNKKSFYYRIVMIKQGEKINMKGTCSAGQKILASLVIKMALAQTLIKNTKFIALDEPTTNLDSEHIRRLAIQLKKMIGIYRDSIQFIVISHDMDFIRMMNEHMQGFYRVSRNERGFTEIKKEGTMELMKEHENIRKATEAVGNNMLSLELENDE